jgi:hypothetical protein
VNFSRGGDLGLRCIASDVEQRYDKTKLLLLQDLAKTFSCPFDDVAVVLIGDTSSADVDKGLMWNFAQMGRTALKMFTARSFVVAGSDGRTAGNLTSAAQNRGLLHRQLLPTDFYRIYLKPLGFDNLLERDCLDRVFSLVGMVSLVSDLLLAKLLWRLGWLDSLDSVNFSKMPLVSITRDKTRVMRFVNKLHAIGVPYYGPMDRIGSLLDVPRQFDHFVDVKTWAVYGDAVLFWLAACFCYLNRVQGVQYTSLVQSQFSNARMRRLFIDNGWSELVTYHNAPVDSKVSADAFEALVGILASVNLNNVCTLGAQYGFWNIEQII